MPPRAKAMDEKGLVALIDGQISDAESYAGSELSLHREKALRYYEGDISVDIPDQEGKSKVVSQDVADTIGWLLPGLMRVFLAAEHIGVYEPERPGDEDFAKQATDYVNYALLRRCQGYQILRGAMFDGLLLGNGILKHWWDETPEYKTEDFTGLDEAAFVQLASDDTIEVLEHSEYPMELPEIMGLDAAAIQVPMLHDVRVKRMTRKGKLMVRVVPGEDFLIEREAVALNEEDCGFCAHRDTPTRSELVLKGYDRATIDDLSAYQEVEGDAEKDARDAFRSNVNVHDGDHAAERVEVYECYVRVDYDGDGVAEWRQVVLAKDGGEKRILSNEEWGDDLPFTDLVPDPVPHRWRGRSIYDEVGEVQKVKSALLRRMLDNLYMTLEPNRAIDLSRVKNPDALVNLKLGENVYTDGDPNSIIRDLVVPFVAKEAAPMLEYWDQVAERRTGVGNRSAGLDKDALQSEPTATATNAMQAVSQSKQEDYARNIAEGGMKRLFTRLLRLIVKHQDQSDIIRLRDQWVQMDPRGWNADMDVTINVGLGSGSRDGDVRTLVGIKQSQEQILIQMGPINPLVGLDQYRATLAKLVEVSGLKNPEQFFKEVTPEDIQKLQQQMSQPKPDPKMMEAQAKVRLEQGKAQAQFTLDQQRAAADFKMGQDRNAAELQVMREKHAFEMQAMREKNAMQAELDREDAERKAQLRREEMLLEAQLTQEANAMNAAAQASRPMDTNINSQAG